MSIQTLAILCLFLGGIVASTSLWSVLIAIPVLHLCIQSAEKAQERRSHSDR